MGTTKEEAKQSSQTQGIEEIPSLPDHSNQKHTQSHSEEQGKEADTVNKSALPEVMETVVELITVKEVESLSKMPETKKIEAVSIVQIKEKKDESEFVQQEIKETIVIESTDEKKMESSSEEQVNEKEEAVSNLEHQKGSADSNTEKEKQPDRGDKLQQTSTEKTDTEIESEIQKQKEESDTILVVQEIKDTIVEYPTEKEEEKGVVSNLVIQETTDEVMLSGPEQTFTEEIDLQKNSTATQKGVDKVDDLKHTSNKKSTEIEFESHTGEQQKVKEREELKAESEELKETVIDLTNESASDKEVKVFSGTEHKAKADAVSDIAQQETCPDSIAAKESLSSSEKQEKGEEKQEKEEEKQEKEEEKRKRRGKTRKTRGKARKKKKKKS